MAVFAVSVKPEVVVSQPEVDLRPRYHAATCISPSLMHLLVHGQVTIIFVVSVALSVYLSVCLFVCAEFFSVVFDPISIKLGHLLTCLGLVVSPRI